MHITQPGLMNLLHHRVQFGSDNTGELAFLLINSFFLLNVLMQEQPHT